MENAGIVKEIKSIMKYWKVVYVRMGHFRRMMVLVLAALRGWYCLGIDVSVRLTIMRIKGCVSDVGGRLMGRSVRGI